MKNKKQLLRITGLSVAVLAVIAVVICFIFVDFEKSVDELFPSFNKDLKIVENAETKYTIVYSDFASNEEVEAANKISEEISKLSTTSKRMVLLDTSA